MSIKFAPYKSIKSKIKDFNRPDDDKLDQMCKHIDKLPNKKCEILFLLIHQHYILNKGNTTVFGKKSNLPFNAIKKKNNITFNINHLPDDLLAILYQYIKLDEELELEHKL